jgi:tetratricopeptide (TPR) repeat protein
MKAADLNNQGVLLLVEGNMQAAMSVFQSALTGIKQIVNNEDLEGKMQATTLTPQPSFLRESSDRLKMLQTEHSFIYDRPLLIDQITTIDDLDSALALLSAAVLFNLALTCHQLGKSGKDEALKRAAVLYRMCMQLLANCDSNDASTTVLALLALNNRAQIHYELCDYHQSKHCLRQCSKIMQDDMNLHGLHETLSPSDLEGLLLNVMLQDPPTAAQAA